MDGGGCRLLAKQGTLLRERERAGGGAGEICVGSKSKTERGLTAKPGTVGDEPNTRGAYGGDLENV